jgi:hypothetical protein
MPNASAALAISFVISMSSRDGLGSPEAWDHLRMVVHQDQRGGC